MEFLAREKASPPRSLAHLKRSITETKWKETNAWADVKVTHKEYRYSRKKRQRPDFIPANANKWHASRLYQLKTGYCLTGQYLHWTKSRPTAKCWLPVPNPNTEASLQELSPQEAPAGNPVGGGEKDTGRGKVASRSGTSSWTRGKRRGGWRPRRGNAAISLFFH